MSITARSSQDFSSDDTYFWNHPQALPSFLVQEPVDRLSDDDIPWDELDDAEWIESRMTKTERCPWPFPGPHYDWTTDDELGSITGQLRQYAEHVSGPLAQSLMQTAKDVATVRALLRDRAVQVPDGL